MFVMTADARTETTADGGASAGNVYEMLTRPNLLDLITLLKIGLFHFCKSLSLSTQWDLGCSVLRYDLRQVKVPFLDLQSLWHPNLVLVKYCAPPHCWTACPTFRSPWRCHDEHFSHQSSTQKCRIDGPLVACTTDLDDCVTASLQFIYTSKNPSLWQGWSAEVIYSL